MLGQNVLGFRDSGILVVTNAGADTDFQESRYFEIVSRYFGGTFPDTIRRTTAPASAWRSMRRPCRTTTGRWERWTAPPRPFPGPEL